MASLVDKIELLIKREKTTPERKKKEEPAKSSSEILSELFGAFNAAPPKIEDIPPKKSKKSKKKHKKEKKKRSRSISSTDSDDSEYSRKRKKRKKSKSKKRHSSVELSPVVSVDSTPPKVKVEPDLANVKSEKCDTKVKVENLKAEYTVKTEPKCDEKRHISIKSEHDNNYNISLDIVDASDIPLPDDIELDTNDLRRKLEGKKTDTVTENDKAKGKIQIKNLKFSAVFEETVKKAEEEARKKKEKTEEGEYTDSSSSSVKEEDNSQFPKSSDPGGILKKQAEIIKISADEKSKKSKYSESSSRSSKKESSSSKRRSRSRTPSRRRRTRSRDRRSRTPRRSRSSRSRGRSRGRERTRSRGRSSRSRGRERSRSRRRSRSPRHRPVSPRRSGRRSPTGVKLADSEKKRLLEVARRNAINMLKNGAVPAGAAALPIHTRNQVMAAIHSGGKSVDELTDFCKHLSKKEALGELSSCSSNGEDMSENEDTLAFHHPFLVKEKAPIVMNIRGGAPLPVKNALMPVANKEELRIQFPVSSGSQHRHKSTEWVPVSPKKDNMQVAKLPTKTCNKTTPAPVAVEKELPKSTPLGLPAPLALPPPPAAPAPPAVSPHPGVAIPPLFAPTSQLSASAIPALPAPGPQAYPPGKEMPKKIDISSIVSEKIAMIRARSEKEHEFSHGLGWSATPKERPGQFTGSTGAQILTPRELASGTQAWAKKDQLQRAAPVQGGMGMQLLQKMGWCPGQGLGKEGTGTLQPLLLEVKLDTRGLQAKEETRNTKAGKPQRQARRGTPGAAAPLVLGGKHPVSLLGEYCSKHKLGPPEYNLCFECGPDHKKNFLFRVKIAGTEYQPAVASQNKKQAKADAAQLALQKLGILT